MCMYLPSWIDKNYNSLIFQVHTRNCFINLIDDEFEITLYSRKPNQLIHKQHIFIISYKIQWYVTFNCYQTNFNQSLINVTFSLHFNSSLKMLQLTSSIL